MTFRNYLQPEGHVAGAPEVFLTPHSVKRDAMPKVVYPALEQLLYADSLSETPGIGIDRSDINQVVLYTSSRDKGLANVNPGLTDPRSFRIPGTKTVYINAAIADETGRIGVFHRPLVGSDEYNRGHGVMEELIYQAALLARYRQYLVMRIGDKAVLPGVTAGLGVDALTAPTMGAAVGWALLGSSLLGLVAGGAKGVTKDMRAAIKRQAIGRHFLAHKNDIVFPKLP